MQNTPKTQDIWSDCSEKLGNLPFVYEILTNLTYLWGKTLKNQDFLQTVTIFAKYLQFYMWFYKGIKVNISATTQKFIVALIYKIDPV